MSETTPVTPRPAAAVVLLRARAGGGVEVFMVRRHVASEFVPDVFVFPGGSVTAYDRETELQPGVSAPAGEGPTALGSGFRVAALRECFEEAGVLLARRDDQPLTIGVDDVPRFSEYRTTLQSRSASLGAIAQREGITLATDALLHWAHWITPAAWPKRFDTHFFLGRMPAEQEAAADQLETTADAWVTPEDALRRFEQGDFPLVFATIHQLRALLGLSDIEAAWARFAGTTPRTIMPRVVTHEGVDTILLPEGD